MDFLGLMPIQIFFLSALANDCFLELIFVADATFTSTYIIKITQ